MTKSARQGQNSLSAYVSINGLNLYYEIHGHGNPLVLIHGGGSTIETSFGMVLHKFAETRQVIAVELQGHGHTADIDRPETFEQDADDVAALLKHLKIENADIFGFSNGGHTTLEIAIRHPQLIRKMVLGSVAYKRNGFYPWFWDFMPNATLDNMPFQLKEAYFKVCPNPDGLVSMFEKDKKRMLDFKDWSEEQIKFIHTPALLLMGDKDVVMPEHAVEMYQLLPNARLSILPGNHGAYIGEITTGMEKSNLPEMTVSLIESFLDEPF